VRERDGREWEAAALEDSLSPKPSPSHIAKARGPKRKKKARGPRRAASFGNHIAAARMHHIRRLRAEPLSCNLQDSVYTLHRETSKWQAGCV
jgi:hypothetical protein